MTTVPSSEPTASFVELCSFIAIRQAQDSEEVVRQLVLRCFAFDPFLRFARATDFATAIQNRFGLRLPENRIQSAIDRLLNAGLLARQPNRDIAITQRAKAAVDQDIADVLAQEEHLKTEWLQSVHQVSPELPSELAWSTLVKTLQKLFRRHGLQTISLLDASLSVSEGDEKGVRAQVREACSIPELSDWRNDAEAAILAFLNGVHSDPNRAAYIARLADSAVSYLSLTVSPEVADRLRRKLEPLDVFLDTNILFGLLGLAEPETTDAARELAHAVEENNLPLTLRFHQDTERELRRTFDGLSVQLRSRVWPPSLSAAAVRARNINTVTRLYHEKNAASAISADSFLKPYEHVDVIIRERGAVQYRESRQLAPQENYDLMADYRAFLEKNGRDKPYEVIAHDVTLLLTVRKLRTAAKSSLDTRAVLVTNDVMLHLFESQAAKHERRPPCTLLLRQLLQLLRPFVPTTAQFDVSFAETFAAPEFRAIDSKAAAATSKLLELLSAYKELSEETATALLTNDLLLGKLQSESDQKGMANMVESALAIQNASLQAERDSLAARLERAEVEREKQVSNAISAMSEAFEREKQQLQEERTRYATSDDAKTGELVNKQQELETLSEELETEKQARLEAERSIQVARDELAKRDALSQRRSGQIRVAAAILTAGIVAAAIEAAVRRGVFPWLAGHQQSYGLRVGTYIIVILTLTGYARRDLRKALWSAGVLPLGFVLLQLLGGPKAEADRAEPVTTLPSSKAK